MKPRIVVLLSGTLTLGLGYWLAENSRDAREIWISLACWLLGFWFASSIMAYSDAPAARNVGRAGAATAEEEEYEEDEEE